MIKFMRKTQKPLKLKFLKRWLVGKCKLTAAIVYRSTKKYMKNQIGKFLLEYKLSAVILYRSTKKYKEVQRST